MTDENCKQILENAHNILLVDWPNADVPLSLLKAGFNVISYAPDTYSWVSVEIEDDKKGKLIFTDLDKPPVDVDVVSVFRPEEEHADIIARHVLSLNAKVIWLQPPVSAITTADLADQNSLIFVEGHDIAAIARQIKD